MFDSFPFMERFLDTILSFPTVPLTVLLGIVIGYWIFALVTGATFDGADAATGAVKGAADAATGAVKGAADAAVGAIKGAGEVAGAHGHSDHDHDMGEGGVLSVLGLAKVPVTITLSTMLLVAWIACAAMMLTVSPAGAIIQGALLAGSLVAGLIGAAIFLRPLGKALDAAKPAHSRDSVGQICTVTSGKVDASFGTAHVEDGGAGLNVHVVCAKPNTLKKGDRAILVDFDSTKNVYEIDPIDWLLPEEIEALNDPTRAAQVISSRVRRK
ncbi:MAG: hypothetical protein QM817_16180 [Archangium sp.]